VDAGSHERLRPWRAGDAPSLWAFISPLWRFPLSSLLLLPFPLWMIAIAMPRPEELAELERKRRLSIAEPTAPQLAEEDATTTPEELADAEEDLEEFAVRTRPRLPRTAEEESEINAEPAAVLLLLLSTAAIATCCLSISAEETRPKEATTAEEESRDLASEDAPSATSPSTAIASARPTDCAVLERTESPTLAEPA